MIITISHDVHVVDNVRTKEMIEAINYLVSINFIKNIKEFWNYFLDNNFGKTKKIPIVLLFLVFIRRYYKRYIDTNYVQPP